jgi:nitric oxide reductase activation protein
MARREKHLAEGDDINVDLLLDHLVDRYREPSPPVRFHEKPVINHRDLAVLILLDVSGSTGEQLGGQAKVLDVEKQTAVILGQGLAAIGDRFAVCGFSSNGREQCEYLLFKHFDDSWAGDATGRIMAAWPRSSTRMGPALRHAGYLLSLQPARQRLVILVTDGKPMDQGYDPNTRYAQYDVRMACEENARQDIHTFAISTEENSQADMEIMFPRRRFVILPSIAQLPRILPQLYLRLTL